MCFGASSPALLMVPESEYDARVEENRDLCIVDDEHFFVRGHIEIPVIDSGEVFTWVVWVSLSEENFDHMNEYWQVNGRENMEPYFGWLMTKLPCYNETYHLKTSVQVQEVGSVPLITLEPTEHLLSKEQRKGISMSRVHEIVHEVMGH